VTPAGQPDQIVQAVRELEGVAADAAAIKADLLAAVAGVRDVWRGAAADAFADRMESRGAVLDLVDRALARAAAALREYAGELRRAQEATHPAAEHAVRVGLRLDGDQIDPTSLLPPDPDKIAAAADLERSLVIAEAEGLSAATQLAASLASLRPLAEQAEHLLGDASGLTPGGLVTDVLSGAGELLWTTGLGIDKPLSDLAAAALGDPDRLAEDGRQLERSLQLAGEHPGTAAEALLGADVLGQELDSGHPGEALGYGAALAAMTIDPETDAGRLAAGETTLARLDRLEMGTRLDRLANVEKATVNPAKFRDYSMRREHPDNQGKWRAWTDVGYRIGTPDERAAATEDVTSQLAAQLPEAPAELTRRTPHGMRFQVRTEIVGPNGMSGTLNTIWQYDTGTDVPRLVTNWLESHP
jgi:uncharacterized protein YukE